MLQHWDRGCGVLCPLDLTIQMPRVGEGGASTEETESTRSICLSILSHPEIFSSVLFFSPLFVFPLVEHMCPDNSVVTTVAASSL